MQSDRIQYIALSFGAYESHDLPEKLMHFDGNKAINLADYDENRFNPNIKCEHCNYVFNVEDFLIAVLLYGLVLCQKKQQYLYGITCPLCFRTLIEKGDQDRINHLLLNFNFMGGPVELGDYKYSNDRLSYYATPLYFTEEISEIKKLNIYLCMDAQDHWYGSWNQQDFNNCIKLLTKKFPDLKEMYQTYIPYIKGITGFYSTVFWFKEDEIENIIKVENEHGIKVLPRYFIGSDTIKNIELFLWKNKYYFFSTDYQTYKEMIKENHEEIDDSNENTKKMESKDIHFDLISILLNMYTEVEVTTEGMEALPWFCDPLLSIERPFYGKQRIDIDQLSNQRYKDQKYIATMEKIYSEIEAAAGKDYVKKFVSEHHQSYIDEYVELMQRKDFTYSSILALNFKYLREIYNIHKKEALNEAKYAFYPEGPSWTITYDGETIRGLRGKGFQYLHYLVSNKTKSFYPEDLDLLDGIELEHINEEPGMKRSSDSGKASPDLSKASKPKFHHADKVSGESVNELHRQYKKLIQEKEKAETDGDPLLLEQAEKNLDEYVDYYSEYFSKGGRIKKFKQKESKVVKDRIAVNIKRALERIKKSSDTIWHHFNNSIAPPYSTELYYRPIKELDWRCE